MPNTMEEGSIDQGTRDLSCSRLKLREELVFVPQRHAGQTYYHIEQPSSSRFFRIGYAEYVLISLLDGNTSFAQAVTLTVRTLGPEALSQSQAMQVCWWLLENDLAQIAPDAAEPTRKAPDTRKPTLWREMNPLWIKLPLFNPDRILAFLLPLVSFLFSPAATCLGLAVIACGAELVHQNWDRFSDSAQVVFTTHNWVWLGLTWIALKLAHEAAHGFVAKRYSGEVREFGLVFVLFAPMAYVDVTSCWRFSSKWQRIHVAAAGMYCELVLAGVAAIVWSQTDSAWLSHILYNVIIMASASTILFNANPLMRLDGYYMLSDWLEIPNLSNEGTRFINRSIRWLFLGSRDGSPAILGQRGRLIGAYGIAAVVWRTLVCVSLTLAASVLFKGAGIVLAAICIVSWCAQPLAVTCRSLYAAFHENRHAFWRALGVGGLLGTVGFVALTQLPWPGTLSAPVIVDYTDISIVRSRIPGFIEKIHVSNGQWVHQGDLLVELSNEDLEYDHAKLQLSIQQTQVQHRMALDDHDPARAQILERNLQALEERLGELTRQCEGLRVVAPIAGRIVARELERTVGTYVKQGHELLAVGDERRKELVLSISQDDIEQALPRAGQQVRFRIGASAAANGELTRIDPRASRKLPHPALSAASGGDLAVTERHGADGQREVELAEPRFRATIALPATQSQRLSSGERGYAVLGWTDERFGSHLWRRSAKWLDEKLKALDDSEG